MPERSWTGHRLRRNAANQRPSTFVFVHVETTDEEVKGTKPFIRHTMRCGTACAVRWRQGRDLQEKWFTFTDADLFWAWLPEWQRKNSVLWVVMYDALRPLTILNLWRQIEDGHYRLEKPGHDYKDRRTGKIRRSEDWHGLKAIEGKPFHLETDGPRGRVNFTDVMNYYPLPLESIAEGEQPIDRIKSAYLRLISRWQKEKNGNWQFSASGLAWSNYRHRFMEQDIMIHQHAEALQLEWDCYRGGETRCWFRGRVDTPLVHYDVNSLYPYVMLDNVYPTALIDHFKGDCYAQLALYIDKFATAADVSLNTEADHYPCRRHGRVIFPVGQFRTQLCGPELLAAFNRGDITAVHSLSIYTAGNIFADYVLYWWEEKRLATKKGDKAGAAFAKLMLNSLPAKFAQRTPMWVDDTRIDPSEPWKIFPWRNPDTGTIFPARSVGWQGQYLAGRKPTENAFPLIFAYVTAYAREYMRRLREQLSPSTVYYQDTDSLIVNERWFNEDFPQAWRIGDGLGELRCVGSYASAEFRGQKNYTVDAKHVIAGIRESDHHHTATSITGLREDRAANLFLRPHDGAARSAVVDLDLPGDTRSEQYGADGWSIPVRLP